MSDLLTPSVILGRTVYGASCEHDSIRVVILALWGLPPQGSRVEEGFGATWKPGGNFIFNSPKQISGDLQNL